MIHNDVLNQFQLLVKTSAPPLVEVAETPAELPQWTPGQKLPAHVLASLPNGRFQTSIGDQVLDMNLPKNTQPGENIELIYVANQPRLTFVLSRETQSTNRANAASNVATAAQDDISLSGDAADAKAGVSLSDTARFLGALMQKVAGRQNGAQASPLRNTEPLVPSPPADSKEFAQVLRGALSQSGLFYESHQAQWVAGERSLAELLHEPQGKLSSANAGNLPAAAAPETPLSVSQQPGAASAGDARKVQVLVNHATILSSAADTLITLASTNPPPDPPSAADAQKAQVLANHAEVIAATADTLKTVASANPPPSPTLVVDAQKAQVLASHAEVIATAAATLKALVLANPPPGPPSAANAQKAQVIANYVEVVSTAAATLKALVSANPPPGPPSAVDAQKAQALASHVEVISTAVAALKTLVSTNPPLGPPSAADAQKAQLIASHAEVISTAAGAMKTLLSANPLPGPPSAADAQKAQVLANHAAVISATAATLKTLASANPPPGPPSAGDSQRAQVLANNAAILTAVADTLDALASPNPSPGTSSAADAQKARVFVNNAAILSAVADTLKTLASSSAGGVPRAQVLAGNAAILSSAADTLKMLASSNPPTAGDAQKAQLFADYAAVLSSASDQLKTLASANPSSNGNAQRAQVLVNNAAILSSGADALKLLASLSQPPVSPSADKVPNPQVFRNGTGASSSAVDMPPVSSNPQSDLPANTQPVGDAHKAQVLVDLQAHAPTGKPMELVHPDTMPLIQQQLQTLDTRQMVWQGQIWPGQTMDWVVEERQGGGGSEGMEVQNWQTKLRLKLPRLGDVSAALIYTPQGLRISLNATETATAETFKAARSELRDALDVAGLPLLELTVAHDDQE